MALRRRPGRRPRPRGPAAPLGPIAALGPVAALGLAAALVLPGPAAAQLRANYEAGVAAIETGEWRSAEHFLRETIALRPTEARRLTFKGIRQPYLPHFYLGIAVARQGDCRGALAAWEVSERQQVVLELAAAGLERERAACGARLERLAELTALARAELGSARARAAELAEPGRSRLMDLGFEGGLGALGARLAAERERIAEAESRLERADAEQDPELAESALDDAREAAAALAAALEQAGRLAAGIAAERERRLARAGEVRELAGRVDALLRSKSPLPPALRPRQQQLESLLAVAVAPPEGAAFEQLERLAERLEWYLGQLESSTPPPPGTLRSGAAAFLRADYPAVLERLAEIPYRDAKTRAHCLLLRSAAAFALHVASGEAEGELLSRAREDADAARAAAPGMAPAASAFSPRFVRFFDGVAPAPPDV